MTDKTKNTFITILMFIWVTYTFISVIALITIISNNKYYKKDAEYMREVCGEYREEMDNWDKDQREIPEWLITEFYKMDAMIYEMEIVILDYDKWHDFSDILHRGVIDEPFKGEMHGMIFHDPLDMTLEDDND